MATSCGPNASTLPRPHKGRSLSRGRVQVVDRRKQRTRPTSSLLLLSSETEGPKGGFTIEVPSGSQPLLTELPASPEVTFRHRWPQRKGSLESSSLRNEGEKNENNQLLPPISLIETELPSVEEAEKLHPLLMELDATPFLDMDQSHT
uniref:Uncharacterized protein n=1 Tax=Mesocestoides corti TaxID=53468 RepID=A0A5K3FZ02_MESCO